MSAAAEHDAETSTRSKAKKRNCVLWQHAKSILCMINLRCNAFKLSGAALLPLDFRISTTHNPTVQGTNVHPAVLVSSPSYLSQLVQKPSHFYIDAAYSRKYCQSTDRMGNAREQHCSHALVKLSSPIACQVYACVPIAIVFLP